MPPPAYSTQFICGEVGGTALHYIVPDGFRAYVRDISGYLDDGGGLFNDRVRVYTIVAVGIEVSIARWEFAAGEGGNTQWYGMAVLNAGQELIAAGGAPGSSWDVIVSGYLLSVP